jgi:hypothetical protein
MAWLRLLLVLFATAGVTAFAACGDDDYGTDGAVKAPDLSVPVDMTATD